MHSLIINYYEFLCLDSRKMSWTPAYVTLFFSNLVFYKDQKAAAQVKKNKQYLMLSLHVHTV